MTHVVEVRYRAGFRRRKIKELDPRFHGRKGFRLESTGQEFKTLKQAKNAAYKSMGFLIA